MLNTRENKVEKVAFIEYSLQLTFGYQYQIKLLMSLLTRYMKRGVDRWLSAIFPHKSYTPLKLSGYVWDLVKGAPELGSTVKRGTSDVSKSLVYLEEILTKHFVLPAPLVAS